MGLAEHIRLYHGGNISLFARSVGQTRDRIDRCLANSCSVDGSRVFSVVFELPQTEIDHIKKVKEA
jgi:hypothetical protein